MRFLKAIVRQMAEAFLMGLLATKMLLVSCKNLFANLFANLKLDVVQALDSMALDSMALDSESNAFGSFGSNESNPLSKKSLHDAKRWLNALKFLFPNVKCLRHAAQAVYTWLVSREDKKIQACLYLYSPDGDTTSSDFFMHALEDYI